MSTRIEVNKETKQEIPSKSWWNWRRSKSEATPIASASMDAVDGKTDKIEEVIEVENVLINQETTTIEMEEKEEIVPSKSSPTSDNKCRKTLRLSSKQIVSVLFLLTVKQF